MSAVADVGVVLTPGPFPNGRRIRRPPEFLPPLLIGLEDDFGFPHIGTWRVAIMDFASIEIDFVASTHEAADVKVELAGEVVRFFGLGLGHAAG